MPDCTLYLFLLVHLLVLGFFFYKAHLLSKKVRQEKVLFKADFMTGGIDRSRIYRRTVCITCHRKNNLLFVTPAKESTFVATHHADEIWQVRSGLESLSQRGFVKPVPSLPTVSQSHQISLLLPTLRLGSAQHRRDTRCYSSRDRAVTSPETKIGGLSLGHNKKVLQISLCSNYRLQKLH